jgi:hypothetical protein
MQWLTEGLLWQNPAATDVASHTESSMFSDLWGGLKNLLTSEEASIELEMAVMTEEPLFELEPMREIPRLLSANLETSLDEDEFAFLESEFPGYSDVDALENLPAPEMPGGEYIEELASYRQPEFMSAEYVEELADREAFINAEFGEAGDIALNQIEMVEMGLADYGTLISEEAMAAGEIATVLVEEAGELLVPMEVDLGPIGAAVGGGVAAALGAASWVGLAVATGVLAVLAGIVFAVWGIVKFVLADIERNTVHRWKEAGNWIKKGTLGWIMLDKLFYPFIVMEVVGDDLWQDKYRIRFLDIFRIAHEMEIDLSDESFIITLIGPYENARIEQFVSLQTYMSNPIYRDGHYTQQKIWPYVYQIDENGEKLIPFFKKLPLYTIVRMNKSEKLGYISRLPSLLNPVYTINGKEGGQWSALPNQFTYVPFVPPKLEKKPDPVTPSSPIEPEIGMDDFLNKWDQMYHHHPEVPIVKKRVDPTLPRGDPIVPVVPPKVPVVPPKVPKVPVVPPKVPKVPVVPVVPKTPSPVAVDPDDWFQFTDLRRKDDKEMAELKKKIDPLQKLLNVKGTEINTDFFWELEDARLWESDRKAELVNLIDRVEKLLAQEVPPKHYKSKYRMGQRWNVTGTEMKMILVAVPQKEPQGDDAVFYKYLLFDETTFETGTPQIMTISENYILGWITDGTIVSYTPFEDVKAPVEIVPVTAHVQIPKKPHYIPKIPKKIPYIAPTVFELPQIKHNVSTTADKKTRRRMVEFLPPSEEYYVFDFAHLRTYDRHVWDWKTTLDSTNMFLKAVEINDDWPLQDSIKYKTLGQFFKNYARLNKAIRVSDLGYQRAMLKFPYKKSLHTLLTGPVSKMRATLAAKRMRGALDSGIISLLESLDDEIPVSNGQLDIKYLLTPYSVVDIRRISSDDVQKLIERTTNLMTILSTWKVELLTFWKDLLNFLPEQLHRLQNTRGNEQPDINSFAMVPPVLKVENNEFAPSYGPRDDSLVGSSFVGHQLPKIPPSSMLEMVDPVIVPPEKLEINYTEIFLKLLRRAEAFGEDPIISYGQFTHSELLTLFDPRENHNWAYRTLRLAKGNTFVPLCVFVDTLQTRGENSNFFEFFQVEFSDIEKIGRNGMKYLMINLGICALKNLPALYFGFHNPTIASACYQLGTRRFGNTDELYVLDKFQYWDVGLGKKMSVHHHPRKFVPVIDSENYIWAVTTYFLYKKRVEMLDSFYTRLDDLLEAFANNPIITVQLERIFAANDRVDDIQQELSDVESLLQKGPPIAEIYPLEFPVRNRDADPFFWRNELGVEAQTPNLKDFAPITLREKFFYELGFLVVFLVYRAMDA